MVAQKPCRDLRFTVLDRLLQHGDPLSPHQASDWSLFKQEWDLKQVVAHDRTWGTVFAGIAQHLMSELKKGKATAVSDLMYNETSRILSDVLTLQC